ACRASRDNPSSRASSSEIRPLVRLHNAKRVNKARPVRRRNGVSPVSQGRLSQVRLNQARLSQARLRSRDRRSKVKRNKVKRNKVKRNKVKRNKAGRAAASA